MDLSALGELMMGRRKQLDLRQEDIAEMSGITTRTIYNIEEGKGNPSFKTLSKLCAILGLEITVAIKVVN